METPVITSFLELEGAEKAKVSKLVEHLRKIADIPCKEAEVVEISGSKLRLQISYPLSSFDKSVAQFLAVLFGEFPFIEAFGKLKFVDLKLPEETYGWFGGPKFGAEGMLAGFCVDEPPLLMAIVKPSLGLAAAEIEGKIAAALAGGFHAVKDDEMQGDLQHARLAERMRLAEKYGRYIPAVNADSMRVHKKFRNTPILANATALGFPLFHQLCRMRKSPTLSHLSLQGTYGHTLAPRVFALLHRLFGCDALITPIGDAGYYRATKKDEMEMVRALTEELPIKKTLPLLTGGARLENLGEIAKPYVRSIPFGIVFGTQIFASGEEPEEMAKLVVQKIGEIRQRMKE